VEPSALLPVVEEEGVVEVEVEVLPQMPSLMAVLVKHPPPLKE